MTRTDLVKQVVIAVLTITATVMATGVGSWWTRKEPHLTVRMNNTVRFKGDASQVGISTFTISSDGTKEAETIECSFQLPGVKEVNASPSSLNANVSIIKDSVVVKVPSLNTGETLQVSVHGNNAEAMPDKLEVLVRGKGVNGENKPPQEKTIINFSDLFSVLTLLSTFGIYFILRNRYSKSMNQILQNTAEFQKFNKQYEEIIPALEDKNIIIERLRAKLTELGALPDAITLAMHPKAIG